MRLSPCQAKEPAMQFDACAVIALERLGTYRADPRAAALEGTQQFVLLRRVRTEVVFKRLGRDRTLDCFAVDVRNKPQLQVRAVEFRRALGKCDLHE